MSCKLMTKKERESLINQKEAFLFDCDGVLWQGSELIPGAKEALKMLVRRNKKIYFVTNNATKSVEGNLTNISKLFLSSGDAKENKILEEKILQPERVLCTSFGARIYFEDLINQKKFDPKTDKIFIIGWKGLHEEIHKLGITTIGSEFNEKPYNPEELVTQHSKYFDPNVKAVLVGLDLGFNLLKLAIATTYIRQYKTMFVVTNADATFPGKGIILPGAGSIVAALKTAVEREPDVVIGKPEPFLLEYLEKRDNISKDKMVMFGDRLDTDIEFANNFGVDSVCVLTGISSEETIIQEKNPKRKPKFVMNALGDICGSIIEGTEESEENSI